MPPLKVIWPLKFVLILASASLPITEGSSQGPSVQRQNSKGKTSNLRKALRNKSSKASLKAENDSAELDKIDRDYQKLIQNDKKGDQPPREQLQKMVTHSYSHRIWP